MSASQEPPDAGPAQPAGHAPPHNGTPPDALPGEPTSRLPDREPNRQVYRPFEQASLDFLATAAGIAGLGGVHPDSGDVTDEAVELGIRAASCGFRLPDVKDTSLCRAKVLGRFLDQLERLRDACCNRLKKIPELTTDDVERAFVLEKLGVGETDSKRLSIESARRLQSLKNDFIRAVFRFLRSPLGKYPSPVRPEDLEFADADLLEHAWRWKHRKMNAGLLSLQVGGMALLATYSLLWTDHPYIALGMLFAGVAISFFTVVYFYFVKKV